MSERLALPPSASSAMEAIGYLGLSMTFTNVKWRSSPGPASSGLFAVSQIRLAPLTAVQPFLAAIDAPGRLQNLEATPSRTRLSAT